MESKLVAHFVSITRRRRARTARGALLTESGWRGHLFSFTSFLRSRVGRRMLPSCLCALSFPHSVLVDIYGCWFFFAQSPVTFVWSDERPWSKNTRVRPPSCHSITSFLLSLLSFHHNRLAQNTFFLSPGISALLWENKEGTAARISHFFMTPYFHPPIQMFTFVFCCHVKGGQGI